MTIVTKPLSEKKEEKGQNPPTEPLVGEVKVVVVSVFGYDLLPYLKDFFI